MLSILGRSKRVCSGLTRRETLQVGGAGLFGLSLPNLLAAEEFAQPFVKGRAKSVIFLFLFGGPSQLETFDMKPEAPSKLRGPFKPIASRTADLRICEHLNRTAQISDKFCVVRTMTHPHNDHNPCHYLQTGHKWTRTADKDAAYPIEHPTSPEDLAATIYDSLGIDPELRLADQQRRPVQILEGGKPLRHLFV